MTKHLVDELLRSKIRDRERMLKAAQAIMRMRRKPPRGWNSVDVLRKLRESR